MTLINMTKSVERWGIFEAEFNGPSEGNPFIDVSLNAEFKFKNKKILVEGFYDGDGIYKIRFMPDKEGNWEFITSSNCPDLDSIKGEFICTKASNNNHGPVRVINKYHFAYEDGTPYYPIGTTCYAWIHQDDEIQEETLTTLKNSPFNKIRMCVFPKHYHLNSNDPSIYPFEGSLERGFNFTHFNVEFFKKFEKRLNDLLSLGIEADLILFHPYDKWGFSKMDYESEERYLRYLIARIGAYRNVWWSLANEYDFLRHKTEQDWEFIASVIVENDPYGHLRSIHNGAVIYDHTRRWITHCSIQGTERYRTAENVEIWRQVYRKPVIVDECGYEGNIDRSWGNLTPEEMVRRFWEGFMRGGYVTHGETYMHPDEILWWAKGGKLYGESPKRIEFLKKIIYETTGYGLTPLHPPGWDGNLPCAGKEGEYYIFYFGFCQPLWREFRMPEGNRYKVEIIDTWNMIIEELPGEYEGTFKIDLPGRPYIAVRMRKI